MLAILIYLAKAARRMLRKLVRGALIIAESFEETQQLRRAHPTIYIEE
jgi:hypothetical protein